MHVLSPFFSNQKLFVSKAKKRILQNQRIIEHVVPNQTDRLLAISAILENAQLQSMLANSQQNLAENRPPNKAVNQVKTLKSMLDSCQFDKNTTNLIKNKLEDNLNKTRLLD